MSREVRPIPSGPTIVVASCAGSLAMIPVFLFGATGPLIREDLGFGASVLGLVVSSYWMAMAIMGRSGGRLVQRWGAATGLRIGVAFGCGALVIVAVAPSTPSLFVGIALGGAASAIIMPATDLAVIRRVSEQRLSIAFAIKQSSLPAASLLAGIGVPTLAVTLGWRWTFISVTLLALPVVAVVRTSWNDHPADLPSTGLEPKGQAPRRRLGPLVVGMGLAMAAVSATGAFYVQAALDKGVGVAEAGLLLAAGSALGVVGRFVFTLRFSARSDPFRIAAALAAVGAIGIVGIALAHNVASLFVATLVAFGAGWGWNGLFTHAVMAAHRHEPARVSGMLVAASATGGVFGPSTFGLLSAATGISFAWALAAGEMLLASLLWISTGQGHTSGHRPGAAISFRQIYFRAHRWIYSKGSN